MKKILTTALAILLVAIVCLAADLTGTYKGAITFQEYKIDLTYKLKAEGEKLTGTISSEYGEIPLLNGKISGDDFTYAIDFGQGPMESKGKFMGDSIVVTSRYGDVETKNTFRRVP